DKGCLQFLTPPFLADPSSIEAILGVGQLSSERARSTGKLLGGQRRSRKRLPSRSGDRAPGTDGNAPTKQPSPFTLPLASVAVSNPLRLELSSSEQLICCSLSGRLARQDRDVLEDSRVGTLRWQRVAPKSAGMDFVAV